MKGYVKLTRREFPPAPVELSPEEIDERYGETLTLALDAYSEDPSYVVEMTSHARAVEDGSRG